MHGEERALLGAALAFLLAAVISVPIAKRLGFSPVVGYLLVGIAIGPVGFNVADPSVVSTVAELGIVMLLFLVGLELKPSSLLSMGHFIFGLGTAQLVLSAAAFALLAYFGLGFNPAAAVVSGLALSVSGTAIALQLLGEELITILPFLAVLAFCHAHTGMGRNASVIVAWLASAVAFGLIHLPTYDWNLIQCLVVIGSARLVLTWAYIWSKNIWVSTGAHIINDWTLIASTTFLAPLATSV